MAKLIGNLPSQIPTNGDLGDLAYQNKESVNIEGGTITADSITTAALNTTGDITFGDNDKAIFGAGSDLQIYHDGSTNKIVGSIDVTGTVTADGLEIDKGGIGETASFSGDNVSGARALQIICSTTSNTGDTHSINAQSSSGILKLSTNNNTERLRIASNGDISFYEDTGTTAKFFWDASAESLGIGTTSPSYNLDVNKGSAGTAARFTASSDNGRGLYFTSADNGIYLGAHWTRDVASSGGIHSWSINSTERMRIDSSGNLLVGTTTAVDKLTVSGDAYVSGGIHLGGTGSANYLDDYEEGTWTATLASGATTTPTTTGYYTKIGRAVYIILSSNFGSITLNGTAIQISGLPFATSSSGALRPSGSIGFTTRSQYQSSVHHFCYVEASSTTVLFRYVGTGVTSGDLLTDSSGTYTPNFQFALTYFID